MKKLLIRLLGKFGYTLQKIDQSQKHLEVINKGKSIIKKISPDYEILNGPFKGMRYPSLEITELTLAPKITGSYEMQLIPLIEKITKNNYDHIIDVGSAEGYYGVGFAKLLPQTTVHCYDINNDDLRFSQQMAELNKVNNITFNNFCSPETLINFNYGKKSLIICDCEGYEMQLFTEHVIQALSSTDILVELHDVINPEISSTLLKRFSNTHHLTLFNNSNVNFSFLNGLDKLSAAEKAFAVYEHRGGLYQNIFMEWAFFSPKNIHPL